MRKLLCCSTTHFSKKLANDNGRGQKVWVLRVHLVIYHSLGDAAPIPWTLECGTDKEKNGQATTFPDMASKKSSHLERDFNSCGHLGPVLEEESFDLWPEGNRGLLESPNQYHPHTLLFVYHPSYFIWVYQQSTRRPDLLLLSEKVCVRLKSELSLASLEALALVLRWSACSSHAVWLELPTKDPLGRKLSAAVGCLPSTGVGHLWNALSSSSAHLQSHWLSYQDVTIACRDWIESLGTWFLLLFEGIPSFFMSCPMVLLDRLLKSHRPSDRSLQRPPASNLCLVSIHSLAFRSLLSRH